MYAASMATFSDGSRELKDMMYNFAPGNITFAQNAYPIVQPPGPWGTNHA